MATELTTLVNKALPALTHNGVTYNAQRNMFVTSGYTSAMGHTYFQGIQLNNRVALVYDIGRGGWGCNPLFLNSVKLYCFDGNDKKLIGSWYPTYYYFYSDNLAKNIATMLLEDYLKSQMVMLGVAISDTEITKYAEAQIAEASNGYHPLAG